MPQPTREEICIFVENSISNRAFNQELIFSLPSVTIRRIKEILYFDLNLYVGVISSHSVRHVKRGHPDDLDYICEIMEILESFSRVEKSLTRCAKTGASLVSLVFYKQFDDGLIKLVKLKVHRNKRLELKTLFMKD
jgi:hypothetical protein